MNSNIFKQKLISQYLELLYYYNVYFSYSSRASKRYFYNSYLEKYRSFLNELKDENNFQFLIDFHSKSVEDLKIPNLFIFEGTIRYDLHKYPYQRAIHDYIELTVPRSFEYLNLGTQNISHDNLRNIYQNLFISTNSDSYLMDLNNHFYKVWILLYLNGQNDFYNIITRLSSSFLSIVTDLKQFDAVEELSFIFFNEHFQIKPNYVRNTTGIYGALMRCFYTINKKDIGALIKDQLYTLWDDNYNTKLTEEEILSNCYLAELGDSYKVEFEDRQDYERRLENPKLNWTFSIKEQAENAFRLGFIDELKLNKLLVRFQKEAVKEGVLEKSLVSYVEKTGFLSLKVDEGFIQSIQLSSVPAPRPYYEIYYFNHEQIGEYNAAFSKETKLFWVLNYTVCRINRLGIELFKFNGDLKSISNEVDLLFEINPTFRKNDIKLFKDVLDHLMGIEKDVSEEWIEIIREIEDSYVYVEGEISGGPVYVDHNNERYIIHRQNLCSNIYNLLKLIDLPNHKLKLAISGGNTYPSIEQVYEKKFGFNQGSYDIVRILIRKIDPLLNVKLKKLRANVKNDWDEITALLEPFFKGIEEYFNDNIQPNERCNFEWKFFLKMLNVYLRQKNVERIGYWVEWCDMLTKKYRLTGSDNDKVQFNKIKDNFN
jgi:hypothetical protein